MRSANTTFPTKTDAEVCLTCKEAEILNGDWINPDAGKVLLADYGTAALVHMTDTPVLFGGELRRPTAAVSSNPPRDRPTGPRAQLNDDYLDANEELTVG
jgi:hypothetical protein